MDDKESTNSIDNTKNLSNTKNVTEISFGQQQQQKHLELLKKPTIIKSQMTDSWTMTENEINNSGIFDSNEYNNEDTGRSSPPIKCTETYIDNDISVSGSSNGNVSKSGIDGGTNNNKNSNEISSSENESNHSKNINNNDNKISDIGISQAPSETSKGERRYQNKDKLMWMIKEEDFQKMEKDFKTYGEDFLNIYKAPSTSEHAHIKIKKLNQDMTKKNNHLLLLSGSPPSSKSPLSSSSPTSSSSPSATSTSPPNPHTVPPMYISSLKGSTIKRFQGTGGTTGVKPVSGVRYMERIGAENPELKKYIVKSEARYADERYELYRFCNPAVDKLISDEARLRRERAEREEQEEKENQKESEGESENEIEQSDHGYSSDINKNDYEKNEEEQEQEVINDDSPEWFNRDELMLMEEKRILEELKIKEEQLVKDGIITREEQIRRENKRNQLMAEFDYSEQGISLASSKNKNNGGTLKKNF